MFRNDIAQRYSVLRRLLIVQKRLPRTLLGFEESELVTILEDTNINLSALRMLFWRDKKETILCDALMK